MSIPGLPRLCDCHLHLQDPRLASLASSIPAALTAENVVALVVNGTGEADWPAVLEWARRDPRVIPSFGLHPWNVPGRSPQWQTRLQEHLDLVPAPLGEIGLDRWIKDYSLPEQEEAFLWQLRLAAQRNLPASIHCLRAWGRLLEILQAEPRPDAGFLLHSYGGSAEMIRPLADLGAFFSISGYFALERNAVRQEAFRQVPKDRLLVETDAPDMLPPERWVRWPLQDQATGRPINHPANLGPIYQFVAELRGEPLDQLAQQVEQNFLRLFGRFLHRPATAPSQPPPVAAPPGRPPPSQIRR